MNDNQLAYNELMQDLDNLPDDLATQRRESTTLRLELNDRKKRVAEQKNLMEEHKGILIMAAGGWSVLGKNEQERGLALDALLRKDQNYQSMTRRLSSLEDDAYRAEQNLLGSESEADILATRLHAVTFKARLHASFLNYISAGSLPAYTNGNGAAYPVGKERLLTPDQTGL